MSTPARAPVRTPFYAISAALLGAALGFSGCGSQTSTTTAPSPLVRCAVTLGVGDATLPAEGGTGRITVTTERECAWTARSEVSWLSIMGAGSGQGDGAVDYRALANPDPVARRGALALNDARAELTQAAAECVFSLRESSASFTPAGGTGTVSLEASSSLCPWSATSDAGWIRITSPASGQGSATIAFQVLATAGPPRTGTLTIAGQRFDVTQAEGCTYSVTPDGQSFPASGGAGVIEVSAGPGCPWTASTDAGWITITGGSSGTGPGTVAFSVAPWTGTTRSGSITVAGQTFSVRQSQNCTYSITPNSLAVGASGGSGEVAVTAPPECPWTAASSATWISITQGASGTGNGIVRFTVVAASSGAARTGTLAIAGETFTVTQGDDGCAATLLPDRAALPAAGGSTTFAVQAAGGCSWSAVSGVPWISVTAGGTGNGNGTVTLAIASNSGGPRSGTVAVAGRTFTVDQQGGCSSAISESSRQVPAAGVTGSVMVTAAAGCTWTAVSQQPWITVTSGSSGSGNGTVAYAVAPNTGAARSGTISIAGHTLTIEQSGACSFAIAPREQAIGNAGGTIPIAVTASAATCVWTTSSGASWISVTKGASGTGDGSVELAVAANTGPARAGSVTVAGHSFVVQQADGCSYALSPQSRGAPPGGASNSFNVITAEGCGWKAVSQAPWLTILRGESGSGPGTVEYSVAPNSGEQSRTGTITVENQVFTVTQNSGGQP